MNITPGKFDALCKLLPAEVMWGDPLTPYIAESILARAAVPDMMQTLKDIIKEFDDSGSRQVPTVLINAAERILKQIEGDA